MDWKLERALSARNFGLWSVLQPVVRLDALTRWLGLSLQAAYLLLLPVAPVWADGVQNLFAPPSQAAVIHLAAPLPNEVVVIINYNAVFGNHAGIFAGTRLSDPAGSYHSARAGKDWAGPSLPDYVDYQFSDGPRIQVYRFMLATEDFKVVEARLPAADSAMPLFCAAAVNNAIAGVGPFRPIDPVTWETPAAVAKKLDAILAQDKSLGVCLMPDGSPCAVSESVGGVAQAAQ